MKPAIMDILKLLHYCLEIFISGYGNIFPCTGIGKAFTAVYALISIPFCLIILDRVGKTFARGVQKVYSVIYLFYHKFKSDRPPDEDAPLQDDVESKYCKN